MNEKYYQDKHPLVSILEVEILGFGKRCVVSTGKLKTSLLGVLILIISFFGKVIRLTIYLLIKCLTLTVLTTLKLSFFYQR